MVYYQDAEGERSFVTPCARAIFCGESTVGAWECEGKGSCPGSARSSTELQTSLETGVVVHLHSATQSEMGRCLREVRLCFCVAG